MGDKTLTAAEAEQHFWDSLKKSNTGLLAWTSRAITPSP